MAIDYACVTCDPSGIATWMPVLIILGSIVLIFFLLKIYSKFHYPSTE